MSSRTDRQATAGEWAGPGNNRCLPAIADLLSRACGAWPRPPLRGLLPLLPPRDQTVLLHHCLGGQPLSAFAAAASVSPSRVSFMHHRALDGLRVLAVETSLRLALHEGAFAAPGIARSGDNGCPR